MTFAQAHESHPEGQHPHLARPLAVVHVEEPVEAEVCGEVSVGLRSVGRYASVERGQDHHHVGHVDETVVLAPKAVLVKHVRYELQVGAVNCNAMFHSLINVQSKCF